ncbi:MAG: PIN domain-containing protein [Cellulomonadaceae bacterium]|jgi:PIN domain nuclease of toxin-antitoxin system|nr:PIN domain-containing protein [Cellulomonadaceae bacterium]
MTAVLDASAVLAYLLDETGAYLVESALNDGAAISAVNWSEVAQKVTAAGGDWPVAEALLTSYNITIIPADADLAIAAALRWQRGSGLSLADRFCLATAVALSVPALTADTAWGTSTTIRQIR